MTDTPDKPTHNMIRQILMNELGLSREYIQTTVENIVEVEAQKRLANGGLERMVGVAVSQHIRAFAYSHDQVKQLVERAIKDSLHQEIQENVEVIIKKRGT